MDEAKFIANRLVGKKESQLTAAEKDEIRREQLRLNPEKFERVGVETHDEEADLRLQNAGDKYHKVSWARFRRFRFTLSLTSPPQKCPAIRFADTKHLTVIPPTVWMFKKLTSLEVSGNSLTEIPSLAELKNLTHLDLSGNLLTCIPESIVSLAKTLKGLSLSFNKGIQEVPECVGSLSNLESLGLEECDVNSFAASILKLKKLRAINLANNPRLPLKLSHRVGGLNKEDHAWVQQKLLPQLVEYSTTK